MTDIINFGLPILEIGPSGPPVINLNLTSTSNLNLPINCVLAGHQREPNKRAMRLGGAINGPMRGIFGE